MKVIMFLIFMFPLVYSAQVVTPLVMDYDGEHGFFFTEKQTRDIYKTYVIRDLLSVKETECDSLTMALDKENLLLRTQLTNAMKVIDVQKVSIQLRDTMIVNLDKQINNYSQMLSSQSLVISNLEVRCDSLDKKVNKMKRNRWIWLGIGVLGGFGITRL